jgi:hypothetical protein
LRGAAFLLAALFAGSTLRAAPLQLPSAQVILEVQLPMPPGFVAEAAPPRFVLLDDGQVFVGGTRSLSTVKLDGESRKAIERMVAEARKVPGLAGAITLGPGDQRYRLFLKKGRAMDMQITGDPAKAPLAMQPLAALVQHLAGFVHDGLKPYVPTSYSMSAREGTLAGGCRRWRGEEPVSRAVFAPRVVPALEIKEREWPTGAAAASICEGGKRYVVTFRPLLPGEQ